MTNSNRVVVEALLAARRLTEMLVLGQKPSREEVAQVDALLRPALEAVDAPAKT